jgi:hypothetical protein
VNLQVRLISTSLFAPKLWRQQPKFTNPTPLRICTHLASA